MNEPHPIVTAARAEKLARAEQLGIDLAFIDALVEQFYARVRADAMLGPIFAAKIADWPPHLARMKAFWGSILRGEPGFSGNPMIKHIAIPGIERAEFDRWLQLFAQTLDAIGSDPDARVLANQRARTIAQSLLTGIRIHRDGLDPITASKGVTHV
jgi:hemoglobin